MLSANDIARFLNQLYLKKEPMNQIHFLHGYRFKKLKWAFVNF